MHSKVWMFSHLIDDEDLAFLQREFVSYQQAMDYYGLGNLSVTSRQWTTTDWVINQLSGCLIYRDLFIRLEKRY